MKLDFVWFRMLGVFLLKKKYSRVIVLIMVRGRF